MVNEKLKSEIEKYLDDNFCCEFKGECKTKIRTRCIEYEEKEELLYKFAEQKENQNIEVDLMIFF